ncbi:MAG: hypothetical protein IJQ68_07460 [Methanobrevibacter sp.]|uniref:hypothetical protein n=1 Tax=Methanobrevibacter sp. TaxID=66852 RepID=UPI0025E7C23E|nr:hypothetical protein [Methanobrevibacter sp.]MBR0271808.1 hypothetical protein [Methanobrevibacter sp.]
MFSQAKIHYHFKIELVFVLDIMISKHIDDENKRKDLKELIILDEAVDKVLLSVALNEDLNAKLKQQEKEFQKELNKKDNELKNKDNEFKKELNKKDDEFKKELNKKDDELKNMSEYKKVLMELKKKGIINDSMLKAMNFNIIL